MILVTDALSQRRWIADTVTGEVTAYDVSLSDQADSSVDYESSPSSRLADIRSGTVKVVRIADLNLAVLHTLAPSYQPRCSFAWGIASNLALGDVVDVAVERMRGYHVTREMAAQDIAGTGPS